MREKETATKEMATEQTAIKNTRRKEIVTSRISRQVSRWGSLRAPQALETLPSVQQTLQAWIRAATAGRAPSELKVGLRVRVSPQRKWNSPLLHRHALARSLGTPSRSGADTARTRPVQVHLMRSAVIRVSLHETSPSPSHALFLTRSR